MHGGVLSFLMGPFSGLGQICNHVSGYTETKHSHPPNNGMLKQELPLHPPLLSGGQPPLIVCGEKRSPQPPAGFPGMEGRVVFKRDINKFNTLPYLETARHAAVLVSMC